MTQQAAHPFLNDDHEALRDQARRFVAQHCLPNIDRWEREGQLPRALHRQAAEAGLLQIGFPEDCGGIPVPDLFFMMVLTEELARIAPMVKRTLAEQRRRAHASALLAGLTAREREVLVSLTTLGTNKAIAKELDISPRTVEKYRATILVRLGVENSAQAIRVAVEGGALQAAQLVGSSSASTGRVAVGDVIG